MSLANYYYYIMIIIIITIVIIMIIIMINIFAIIEGWRLGGFEALRF